MPHLSLNTARVALAFVAMTGLTATAATTADAKTQGAAAKARHAVKRADLVARNIHLDSDDAGGFAVGANITNVGNTKARRSDVSFVISGDQVWDDDDEVVDAISIPKVLPGVTRSVSDDIDLSDDEALPEGDLYLLVCADGNGVVTEKTEGNNCTSQEIASSDDSSAADDSGEDDTDTGDDVATEDE
jgi:hypothetical protein